MKDFLNLFFVTLEATVAIEDATVINETYAYNILCLTKTFF
jgi:hypothetical protein